MVPDESGVCLLAGGDEVRGRVDPVPWHRLDVAVRIDLAADDAVAPNDTSMPAVKRVSMLFHLISVPWFYFSDLGWPR